jgi:hypothetical protein
MGRSGGYLTLPLLYTTMIKAATNGGLKVRERITISAQKSCRLMMIILVFLRLEATIHSYFRIYTRKVT